MNDNVKTPDERWRKLADYLWTMGEKAKLVHEARKALEEPITLNELTHLSEALVHDIKALAES